MKRNLLFAVLAITGFLFGMASCQKAPELTLTSSPNIEFSADGSSGSITFTANRDWTARAYDSWVSVSPSSGTASDGPVTVTVRCNANTTYKDRSTTVTINMGDLSQTVSVKQPANKGIVLPKQVFELQSDTRSIDVEVQANVQYSVSSSVDWIKQTGTKALTSKTLTFSIQENKTYDSREGKITIKPNEGNVQEQVITVRQAQKDALIVEKTSYDMPYGGGEIEIKVEANVAFNVTPNVDWLHYIQTKALTNSTVCIKVDENTTYSNREGKIEIAQQNGTLKHTITVKQAGRIAVTSVELNKTSLQMKEGDTETLIATVRPDNATDKTVTWSSSDVNIASVDASGKVTAIKEGTATITAKAGDKSVTCVVTVVSSSIPEGNISFADANLKAKLVAAFDTNKDGELSYQEAAAVSSLLNVFGDETSFTSFDELQYFTSLSYIEPDLFKNWINLKRVTLPESVEKIYNNAFYNCYNLENISFPAKLKEIHNYVFFGCSSLSGQLAFPDGIGSIGSYAFAGCSNISGDLIIPSSSKPQSIGEYAFSNCTGLNGRLILPTDNTIYVNPYAFVNCSFSGDLVVNAFVKPHSCAFSGIKIAGSLYLSGSEYRDADHAFEYAMIGENLIVQDDVKWLSQHPFVGVQVGGYIYIGESVVSLSGYCFDGAKFTKMYVAALTPPSCATGPALSLSGRYLGVPEGRLEVYQSTPPWNGAETIEEVDFSSLKTKP